MRRFPDVQVLLVNDLETLAGDGRTAIETPPDLEERLPFVRIRRSGGSSDRLNDVATVDIDVFAGTYTAGELLAEQIREYLVGPPPPLAAVDRVVCEAAPRELPWGQPDGPVRRWGATYQLISRRRAF